MNKFKLTYTLPLCLALFGCDMWIHSDGTSTAPLQEQTTLSVSVSSLALAINCLPSSTCATTQNAELTGNVRQIVVTNSGTVTATNISIDFPTWPSGTTAGFDTCSNINLAAGASCTFSITPGDTATSNCDTGIAPTPDTISISASNAAAVTTDVVILTYGCIYQGGYLFAVDDSTADTGSIGGKVLSQSDQAQPRITSGPQATSIIWSSDGNSNTVEYDAIYGITDISTSLVPHPNSGNVAGQSACNGKSDGSCNSTNINVFYQSAAPSAPVNLSFYAAGLCEQTISGYSDWYLPAICEMGPDSNGTGCTAGTSNVVDNISSLLGDPSALTPSTSCSLGANCMAGYYWSSTQSSINQSDFAWTELFEAGGGSASLFSNKNLQLGVRCVRAVTL